MIRSASLEEGSGIPIRVDGMRRFSPTGMLFCPAPPSVVGLLLLRCARAALVRDGYYGVFNMGMGLSPPICLRDCERFFFAVLQVTISLNICLPSERRKFLPCLSSAEENGLQTFGDLYYRLFFKAYSFFIK